MYPGKNQTNKKKRENMLALPCRLLLILLLPQLPLPPPLLQVELARSQCDQEKKQEHKIQISFEGRERGISHKKKRKTTLLILEYPICFLPKRGRRWWAGVGGGGGARARLLSRHLMFPEGRWKYRSMYNTKTKHEPNAGTYNTNTALEVPPQRQPALLCTLPLYTFFPVCARQFHSTIAGNRHYRGTITTRLRPLQGEHDRSPVS